MKRIETARALAAIVREDWASHNREILSPGFHALAIYRLGVWVHDRDSAWLRAVLHPIYRLLAFLAANAYGIELPWQATVGRRLRLPHRGGIVIHQRARIGDDVLIRQGVTIGVAGRGKDDGAPVVGDRVEFGAGAVAFGPIEIGQDVIVGPNVVVSASVPPFSSLRPPAPEVRARRGADAERRPSSGSPPVPAAGESGPIRR